MTTEEFLDTTPFRGSPSPAVPCSRASEPATFSPNAIVEIVRAGERLINQPVHDFKVGDIIQYKDFVATFVDSWNPLGIGVVISTDVGDDLKQYVEIGTVTEDGLFITDHRQKRFIEPYVDTSTAA
jgi:hypothetical protein